jgi:hypothetical protein
MADPSVHPAGGKKHADSWSGNLAEIRPVIGG